VCLHVERKSKSFCVAESLKALFCSISHMLIISFTCTLFFLLLEILHAQPQNIASTTQASATAAVLKNFLPMYDKFNNLKDANMEDEFGVKYSELNLLQTFSNMGVTDFGVEVGEKVNNFRMKVLESEASEQPKDTVLRQVAPGLELGGNVIRAALCVSSSGAPAEASDESTEGEGASE
jgi:hypothetical protein